MSALHFTCFFCLSHAVCESLLRVFPKPFHDVLALIEGLSIDEETGDLLLATRWQ